MARLLGVVMASALLLLIGNLASGVYHKEGKFYGKTKRGEFMSGYREAKAETASKTSF